MHSISIQPTKILGVYNRKIKAVRIEIECKIPLYWPRIDISQIAVQRGNFRRLQHAVSLCSLDDPFSNLSVSREHLRAMDAVVWCI
jgi:hypothetical protein